MQLMDRISGKPSDLGYSDNQDISNVRLVEFTPVIAHPDKKAEVLPTFVMHVNDAPAIIRTAEAVECDGPAHVFIAYTSYEQMRLRIPNALGAERKLPNWTYTL